MKIARNSEVEILEAMEMAATGHMSLRQIARVRNIPFATLRRRWAAVRGYQKEKLFPTEVENRLIQAIRADLGQVLENGENVNTFLKKKSFEFAQSNNVKLPVKWIKMKGPDKAWIEYLITKYPDLAPIGFSANVSATDVKEFDFDIDCYTSVEEDVLNDDETLHEEHIADDQQDQNDTFMKKYIKPVNIKEFINHDQHQLVEEEHEMVPNAYQPNREVNFVPCDRNNYDNTVINIWGSKFLSLSGEQKMLAEKAINDILFEAQMGHLTKESIRFNS